MVSESTTKLILKDGTLEEYSYEVTVSYLLLKHQNVFICNSEHMEFDRVLTAVKNEECLQLGELYFALPLTRLSRPLPVEEMASLAVKANAALLNSTQGMLFPCQKKKVGFFSGGEKGLMSTKVADVGSNTVKSVGRRRMFKANLSAIPE